MFTVKFLYEEASTPYTESFACSHYEVIEGGSGNVLVTVFPSYTKEKPLDVFVEPENATHCYVENLSGKTIAHYTWK